MNDISLEKIVLTGMLVLCGFFFVVGWMQERAFRKKEILSDLDVIKERNER